jgi:hypothetical protein
LTTESTASSSDLSPFSAASTASTISSIASATIVLSTVFGSASEADDPSARNSNLLPVKANGEVRLRSPPCIGSDGSTEAPSSR